MSQIIVTEAAAQGLERCRQFLANKNPLASIKAAHAIENQFSQLLVAPYIGRPVLDSRHLHELIIPFGDSGYVALYTFDEDQDLIYILAFRHQKETGYHP